MNTIESNAFYKLSYGLFVLMAGGAKESGCIINTCTQISDEPKLVSIAVNKANYTNSLIKQSGKFSVSVLAEDAGFDIFRRFGFQSGRDTDKLAGFTGLTRSESGLLYVTEGTNAFLSCEVVSASDFGTHTVFIAKVNEAKALRDIPSATYAYYFSNIKPKQAPAKKIKGYVCRICGYVYEGETLPPDFVCPLCNHGAEFFDPIV